MPTTTTMPQVDRVAASEAAVRARQARAELKERLRTGSYDHRQALLDSADVSLEASGPLATLRVTEFLETLPFVGRIKRERMMADLAISDRKRLGGLGHRQRRELWDLLDSWLRTHPVVDSEES